MCNFRTRLPPLDPLVSFEAAARLLNFTAAAKELRISQSAVSQNIRNLEEYLGVPLFTRAHRSVDLTHLGKAYQQTVTAMLENLADATAELRTIRYRRRLTIGADQSIAWMWLMPRMPLFQKANPDIVVRLVASDIETDCMAKGIDLAIVYGTGQWPGYESLELFPEEVFPVCSPDYLENGPPLETIEDLSHHTLIHLEDEHWGWVTWRMWLPYYGVQAPAEQQGLVANNYPLLIEAAKKGQGIALGWRYLIDHALGDGTLVRPFEESLTTDSSYYIVWPSIPERSSDAKTLCDWLVAAHDTTESRVSTLASPSRSTAR